MATEEQILEDQKLCSDRISTQVRTVGLSMIAVSWVFLSGSIDATSVFANKPSPTMLLSCGLLAFLSLVADYLQYVVAFLNAQATHLKGPDGLGNFRYDINSKSYLWRGYFFYIKQGLLWFAIFVFLAAFIFALR